MRTIFTLFGLTRQEMEPTLSLFQDGLSTMRPVAGCLTV